MERREKPIVYLDTHVLVHMAQGQLGYLSSQGRYLLEHGILRYAAISRLELHYLHQIKRVPITAQELLKALETTAFVRVSDVPIEQVVIQAETIDWTRDPFDCLIAAESMLIKESFLITKDRVIQEHHERALS